MTDSPFARLLLPHIAQLEPYTPIQPFEVLSRQLGRAPEQIVKLDANENPYGPAPAVREALAGYPFTHIYPDPEQRELREALADYVGVSAEHILPGSGADELIDLVCRLTLAPGNAIVDCPPTFGMYSFDAGLTGARVLQAWRRADFSVDVERISELAKGKPANRQTPALAPERGAGASVSESADQQINRLANVELTDDASRLTFDAPHLTSSAPKLLFLTSPNNPDGSLLAPADLARLLTLPLLVILDEAYVEFAGLEHSLARWVLKHDNLIVLRTFSKWAGIAGLRLGYGIFPAWLMPALWKAKQPYNVNVAATVAGLASLAHRAEIQRTVDALIDERERLYQKLTTIPFLHPYPSRANFVLCRVEGRSAAQLKAALANEGILVRHYAKAGLENCIRVSAGRPEQTDALLVALARV